MNDFYGLLIPSYSLYPNKRNKSADNYSTSTLDD